MDQKESPLNFNDFKIHFRWLVACLIGIVFLVYYPMLGNDFIHFDEDVYVVQNVHFTKGITFDTVVWAWTQFYASNWHPLTWMSHMADILLYGFKPMGHHATNLLLHLLTTLLLFWSLSRMTRTLWRPFFTAVLFAIHPVHIESVAWIAERKDLLCASFWMLTFCVYYYYDKNRTSSKRYALVMLCVILALLAKPMAVTLFLILILLDFWPLRKNWLEELDKKIPFFLVCFASGLTTLIAQSKTALRNLDQFPLMVRLANAAISYVGYLGKMIWPTHLSVYYIHDGFSISYSKALYCFSFLLLVTAWVISQKKKRPYLLMGWLWYIITLLPVIGIIQVGDQAMADRYTYLPLIGIFIMISWGIADLMAGLRKIIKVILLAIFGTVLCLLIMVSHRQLSYWKTTFTLFNHTLESNPKNFFAYFFLASYNAQLDRCEEALRNYGIGGTLRPYKKAFYNMGYCFKRLGRISDAIDAYNAAIYADPKDAGAYNNLGSIYLSIRSLRQAETCFRNALDLNPDLSTAYYNLGLVRENYGLYEEARKQYQKAIELQPDYTNAKKALVHIDEMIKKSTSSQPFQNPYTEREAHSKH